MIINQQDAKNIKYTSSDPNIAVVDNTGKVTGKKAGKVKITVETDKAIGYCDIEVKNNTKAELGQKIVKYAEQFLGVPYILSQASPKAFDCSGLVQYVYKKFGYSLPRRARDQALVGKSIKLNEIQAGDLIFYSSLGPNGRPTHVVFYYRDNKILHAEPPAVKITSLRKNNIVAIKRII